MDFAQSRVLSERKIRFHACFVGFIEDQTFAELPFTFRPLQAKKMTARRLRTQNLAAGGDFEPLRDRLSCLTAGNWLRHEARNIDATTEMTNSFLSHPARQWQHPNPDSQAPKKSQSPNFHAVTSREDRFEYWRLEFPWDLVPGIWDFLR